MKKRLTPPSPQEIVSVGVPLSTLASWYYIFCEAKNLQPRTLLFYRQKLCYLIEAYGDKTPEEITVQELRQLTVNLQKTREWSTQQTNHFITVCKQFFNYLIYEELTNTNPTKKTWKGKAGSSLPAGIE